MTRSDAADRWQKRLKRFQASNLTVAAFCQSEDVSQASFYHWKRKLVRRDDGQDSCFEDTLQFVPLQVAAGDPKPAPTDCPVTATASIELPGGVRIRIEVPAERRDTSNDRGLAPEATR
jgi:hypothetical protein